MAVFAPDPALHFTDAAGGYGDMSAVVLCCSSSSSSSSSTSSSSSSSSSPSSDRHHVSASSSTLRSRFSLSSPSGRHYHARDRLAAGPCTRAVCYSRPADGSEVPPLMKMTIKSPSKFDGTRQLPSFYPLPITLSTLNKALIYVIVG